MVARASVLGAVVLASGVVSHVAAGGLLPHPAVLGLLLTGGVAVSAHLVRSPASATRLVTVVVLGQTVLHGLLSLLAGHRAPTPPPLPAPHGHSHDHGLAHGTPAAVSSGSVSPDAFPALDHLLADLAEQGPLMVLTHAAGAAALGWWLAVGESALWHVLLLAAAEVRATLVAARAVMATRACVLGSREASRHLVVPAPLHLPLSETLPHRLVSRRGPPVLVVV